MDGTLTRRALLLGAAGAVMTLPASTATACVARPGLAGRCQFGAWASMPGGDLVADHVALEELLRVPLPVFSWFTDWKSDWDAALATRIASLGEATYDCMVAWEAWGVPFSDIVSGRRDEFLTDFFDGVKSYRGNVVIRLFHEMNGDWYPWTTAARERTVASVDQWKQAWRHVVDVARSRKAANVRFMFCPNTNDVGGVTAASYWPGAEYVDVIGVDGYNWGWKSDGSPTVTAEQVIAPMYALLAGLHPTAEFMVGEIGCAQGENKAAWYEALLSSTSFPRLTAVSFFHEKKERDWRLDSDQRTLAVIRDYLGSSWQCR